jgi:hypothetical protein
LGALNAASSALLKGRCISSNDGKALNVPSSFVLDDWHDVKIAEATTAVSVATFTSVFLIVCFFNCF